MKRIGEYIIENPLIAGIAAFVFAAIPLLGWVSSIIVALVTLTKGWRIGLIILLCSLIPESYGLLQGSYWELVIDVVTCSYIWLMAWLLSYCKSWSRILEATALICIATVLILHGYMDDIVAWWQQRFDLWLDQVAVVVSQWQVMLTTLSALTGDQVSFHQEALTEYITLLKQGDEINAVAVIFSGLLSILLLLVNLVNVAIARAWQLSLAKSGKLFEELYAIRLHWLAAIVLVVNIVLVIFNVMIAWDVLVILLTVFILAGLSLIHDSVSKIRFHGFILLGFYLFLIICSQYITIFLVGIALLDSVFNVRRFVRGARCK